MAIPSLSTNGTPPKRERASASSQISLFCRWILMENRFMNCQSKCTVSSSTFRDLENKKQRREMKVLRGVSRGDLKLKISNFLDSLDVFTYNVGWKSLRLSVFTIINENSINFSSVHLIKILFKLFYCFLHTKFTELSPPQLCVINWSSD